ncbi:outer membrane usher protein [Escherichia albertii]|uniref:outer membrane usher protein n=1 Tax=Escherichia albertii TaxID=208962 RepID=UPI000CF680CF|nr:outer membrane usher protein [Escherichia albertii]EEW0787203.1 outer membrane usher protein [Escherichia albertii]EFB5187505.1 outer membrane usher protein [Escherichia albertii]MCZ8757006.1 outer membrane usher protein [Escherichia albertii]MDD9762002.1 outer membrane usher protein [Escherichia albertii]
MKTSYPGKKHQRSPLACLIACSLLPCAPNVWGADETVEFDNTFLMGAGARDIDVNRYSTGNATLPGRYDVSIFINNQAAASLKIEFIETEKKQAAQPCISASTLLQLHIRQPDKLAENAILQKRDSAAQDCLNLAIAIPQSSLIYNSNDQRLDISVPQIWLQKTYANYVDPSLWDEGINAAMLSYTLNGWRSESPNQVTETSYAGLMGGVNLWGWHFRSHGNYSWDKDNGGSFDFQDKYLQHDIAALRSQLIVGDTNTTGETFDSVGIRGLRLYSESRMLPPTLASYAPVIRGVANSNAKVTITQNGYKIYETTVPPGPFAIDDLTPAGFGADLEVTITESDGSTRTFSQAYSSVIQMMRPGVGKWDISAGEVNKEELQDKPNLLQGTYYYGLNNTFTGYTGLQMTDNGYWAGLLGVGINTSLGAFSFDVTQSHTEIPDDETYGGQSYRISWNKYFAPTETSLNIAAYRYSTENYLGLNDALTLINAANHPEQEGYSGIVNYQRMKNQFSVSLNQTLKNTEHDYGSFYLNGTWTDYWATNESQSSFAFGYSNAFNWASYSISLQRTYDEDNSEDDSLYLSVTIPFDKLLGRDSRQGGFKTLNASVNSDMKGSSQYNASASGYSLDNRWSYSVNTAYNVQKESDSLKSVSGYTSYESPWGTFSGSASTSSDSSHQYGLSTDGGFVLHRHGLTFSNDSFTDSDTLALINAPGAKGARINFGNSTVDRFGYGVSSSLSPYHENTVTLAVDDLDDDVELKSTSTVAIPRQGSVIFSHFDTDTGRSAILNVVRSDNQPVPFAADITDENGVSIGTVGQGSQAFVRGITDSGELTIAWYEKNSRQQCRIHYQIPSSPTMTGKTIVLNAVPCTRQ